MDSFVFWGFGAYAWITLITVFAMFTVLLFTKIRSDVVFLCAVGILYLTGVLDVKETLSGISQSSVAVVGVLFATPIGSPTHMLVYGPGGYRFADFLKIGLIMNIIILAANILIVNLVYPLTPLQ